MKRTVSYLVAVMLLSLGCVATPQRALRPDSRPVSPSPIREKTAVSTPITGKIPADPAIEAIIAPYRNQLSKEMNTVIGTALTDLTRGRPEGTLGDFVSDVILETARHFQPVDCAITNNGGLRAPIYKGPVTVGSIFQLMPFENRIVIARFTGDQFMELIREIVARGGVPVSGLTIVSTDGVITAYVGNEKVEGNRSYTVATIDYLLNGGGSTEALWQGKPVRDTGILLREAIIEAVRKRGDIRAQLEGRVVIQ